MQYLKPLEKTYFFYTTDLKNSWFSKQQSLKTAGFLNSRLQKQLVFGTADFQNSCFIILLIYKFFNMIYQTAFLKQLKYQINLTSDFFNGLNTR